ncbi:MAG: hypothetical protein NVSMB6_16160 [Burkholderiaceae bacterium]
MSETERRRLIRMDSAKVNIAPALGEATWFRLVGVRLENGNDLYPNGKLMVLDNLGRPAKSDLAAKLAHTTAW